MQAITEESDHHSLGKTVKKEENVTFHAGESSQKGKMVLKCFNCQKKGHKKADCWAEGGGKAGQGPKGKGQGRGDGKGKKDKQKAKESAASVKDAWMAMLGESNSTDSDDESLFSNLNTYPSLDELLCGVLENNCANNSDSNSCPDLEQIFSDDEKDKEEEEGLVDWEDWGKKGPKPTVNEDSGDAAYTTTFDLGMLSGNSLGSDLIETELFDSGTSRHMSGYRHCFINFTNIEAKPITEADKQTFHAKGGHDN